MAMHRSSTTAKTAALYLLLSWTSTPLVQAFPDGPGAIAEARARIAANDARAAVRLLETALAGASGKDRAALLEPLRTAYAAAIRQAEAEGKRADAEVYRDDLEILNRKAVGARSRPATPVRASEPRKESAPEKEPAPAPPLPVEKPAPAPPITPEKEPIRPLLDPAPSEQTPPASESTSSKEPAVPPTASRDEPAPKERGQAESRLKLLAQSEEPATDQPRSSDPATTTPVLSTEEADAAFVAGDYDKAGRIYAELYRNKALPPDRRDHWGYCRSRDVVRRINAKPASATDWAAIDQEIQSIQQLCPESWFAEYLRNRASERNVAGKTRPGSNKLVVRGNSPDEQSKPAPQPPPSAPTPAPSLTKAPTPERAPAPKPESGTLQTVNFTIKYSDRELAERVAKAAEEARETQIRRWSDPSKPIPVWTSKCEIHLYPNSETFGRETGQRPESAGFSAMSMSEGKVVARRINLRGDHPNVVRAVLPHEVTHVVLADLFPDKQIPRWADEGIAVLAEPAKEQALRASDLDEPLAAGKLFAPHDLFRMDYPENEAWALYYAQSVSMTRFLVEAGTPVQFIRFVRESQTTGAEAALRSVYKVSSFDELQKRWLAYARENASSTLTASSEKSEKVPSEARR
jgi:hypothetical protein